MTSCCHPVNKIFKNDMSYTKSDNFVHMPICKQTCETGLASVFNFAMKTKDRSVY